MRTLTFEKEDYTGETAKLTVDGKYVVLNGKESSITEEDMVFVTSVSEPFPDLVTYTFSSHYPHITLEAWEIEDEKWMCSHMGIERMGNTPYDAMAKIVWNVL